MGAWYHTWSKYIVKDPLRIPSAPHWAVMVFNDRRFTQRGYDRDDPDEVTTVTEMTYYAFTDKTPWESMVRDIYTELHKPKVWSSGDNERVVFFHSGGQGSVNIDINVKVSA